MPSPSFAVRPASPVIIVWVVICGSLAVAAANFFMFSREDSLVWALHRASNGWVNANLTIFLPMTVLIVGGLIMGWDGQRLSDLGLRYRWPLRLLLFLIAGWAVIQLMAILATVGAGTPLNLHPAWAEHGTGTVLGLLLAMVLGTALFEDLMFRGYLLPQVYFALADRVSNEAARLVAALLLCATIFALWHLPTILLNRVMNPAAVVGALAYVSLGGLMLGLLYLRTGQLEVVIALHALVNAPTMLVASPLPGSLLAGIVGVGAIIAGPLLAGKGWSAKLARPERR